MAVNLKVRHNGEEADVVIYKGIPVDELKSFLRLSFSLDVVGFKYAQTESNSIVIPISTACLNPEILSTRVYEFVSEPPVIQTAVRPEEVTASKCVDPIEEEEMALGKFRRVMILGPLTIPPSENPTARPARFYMEEDKSWSFGYIHEYVHKDRRPVNDDGHKHQRGMFRYTFHNEEGEMDEDYVSEGDDTVQLLLT